MAGITSSPMAPRVVATIHPSAVLRAPELLEGRQGAYKMLVADLRVAAVSAETPWIGRRHPGGVESRRHGRPWSAALSSILGWVIDLFDHQDLQRPSAARSVRPSCDSSSGLSGPIGSGERGSPIMKSKFPVRPARSMTVRVQLRVHRQDSHQIGHRHVRGEDDRGANESPQGGSGCRLPLGRFDY